MLTVSDDKTCIISNAENGSKELVLKGHSLEVNSAVFSPDGNYVLSGSYDNTTRIWNSISGNQERILGEHSDNILSVDWSADGKRFATASV